MFDSDSQHKKVLKFGLESGFVKLSVIRSGLTAQLAATERLGGYYGPTSIRSYMDLIYRHVFW